MIKEGGIRLPENEVLYKPIESEIELEQTVANGPALASNGLFMDEI